MKKTTKFLLVLAAVVAMTIGAVSTVMAADSYPVIDPKTWDCTDGWYAKDTNGNQITTGWAVDPDGHYYYFSGKKALENAFIVWKGETYYFGKDCIMAEGWVKFTVDDNAILDVDNDQLCNGDVLLDGNTANPYGKVVWCFFEKGGAAARNKWVEVEGLWYYFEDKVMVSNTFAYVPAGDTVAYGFSGNGNMHVGWIKANAKYDAETPYEKTSNCWLYYNTDGTLVNAGWKKINGTWYYFVNNTAGSDYDNAIYRVPVGATVLLTNVITDEVGTGKTYYFDGNGAMVTTEVTLKKNAKVRTSIAGCLNNATTTLKANTTMLFQSDGTLKTGANGSNYYLAAGDTVYALNTYTVATTDLTTKPVTNATTGIAGDKVFNAFRVASGKVYYYDETGTMVKNTVLTFGQTTIAFNSKGEAVLGESPEKGVYVAGRYYYFANEFGTVDVNGIVIPGCSVRKLSTVSGSAA